MIERLTVLYDGAVGPSATGAAGASGAFGFVVLKDAEPLHMASGFIPSDPELNQTVAEYAGFIEALRWLEANDMTGHHVRFQGRTLMIVNQMTGRWKAKGYFESCHATAAKIAQNFSDIGFDCVQREATSLPRYLAEQSLRSRGIEVFVPSKRTDAAKQD